MKKKIYLSVLLSLAGALFVAYLLKKQADGARAESDKIMNDFRTVEEGLQRSSDSLQLLHKSLVDSIATQ